MKSFFAWLNESESFQPEKFLTKDQINWCNKHIGQHWSVNSSGEVTVGWNLTISTSSVSIPIQFADVKDDFDCRNCKKLVSLKGSPRKVYGDVYISYCTGLTTLEGAPEEIGGAFYHNNCTSVPKEELDIAKDKKLFSLWMKSKLSIDEFKKKYHGSLTGHKFGI